MNADLRNTLLVDFVDALAPLATAMLNDLPKAAREQVADSMETLQAHLELRVRVSPLDIRFVLVPENGANPVELAARTDLH